MVSRENNMTKLDKLTETYLNEGFTSKAAKKIAEIKPFKLKSGAFEGKNATTLKTAIQKAKLAKQEAKFKRAGRGL